MISNLQEKKLDTIQYKFITRDFVGWFLSIFSKWNKESWGRQTQTQKFEMLWYYAGHLGKERTT